jgi:hypothetical protein
MDYVTMQEAVRIIMRSLPGGDELAPAMTDEYFRRGVAAFEKDEARSIFGTAVARLGAAIQSGAVEVVDEKGREILARNHMIDVSFGRLIPKPGYHGGVVTGVMVKAQDLERRAGPGARIEEKPRTALPAKKSMPEAVAAKLLQLFPEGRPPGLVKDLQSKVENELGIKRMSPTTFKRGMGRAWGDGGPK